MKLQKKIIFILYLTFCLYVNFKIYYSHSIIRDYPEITHTAEWSDATDREMFSFWLTGVYELRKRMVDILVLLNIFFLAVYYYIWRIQKKCA